MNQTYPTYEKLKQKKEIGLLFEKGKWKSYGDLRVISFKNEEFPFRVGVSVSKRNFKKAVDRNRAKRLLRECYRLNKSLYKKSFGEKSLSMLFFTGKTLPKNFHEIQESFLKICEK